MRLETVPRRFVHALSLPEVTQWAYADNFADGGDARSAEESGEPAPSVERSGHKSTRETSARGPGQTSAAPNKLALSLHLMC